jgi:surface carbohydrate biosynthesis protein
MKDIDVLYLYEHAVRELDVACAVKYYLQQRYGLSVKIIQFHLGIREEMTKIRPQLVVLPFCYAADTYRDTCLLYWPKAIYFNLAWEQIFYRGIEKSKAPRDEFSRNHVLHHAWGDFYAEYLQVHRVAKEHIFMNGNPAYALYDEPYRHHFMQRKALAEKHDLDPTKKWVFFPENYKWAFLTDRRRDSIVQLGQSHEIVDVMEHSCQQSLPEVMRWFCTTANELDVEIIIRPRPATPLEHFQTMAEAALDNVPDRIRFIKDETVREWILASDVVVSSISTSLIEAGVAGKATYVLEPYPIPDALYANWLEDAPRLKSRAELVAACLDKSDGARNQLGNWARRTMMAHGDSISNLADFMARLCREETKRPPVPDPDAIALLSDSCLPNWLRNADQKMRWLAGTSARRALGLFPKPAFYASLVEIAKKEDEWHRTLASRTA